MDLTHAFPPALGAVGHTCVWPVTSVAESGFRVRLYRSARSPPSRRISCQARPRPSTGRASSSRIKVAPGAPHRLVAAAVDEVGAKDPVAVAEEHVVAVPLVHAEIDVEAVRDGVPGCIPAHLRLQAGDVRLRRVRSPHQGGVAGVQMGEVGDLVAMEGAAAAGVVGPAPDARPSCAIVARSVGSGLRARKRKFCGRDRGPETASG
jgi:hypothetical protein